MAPLPLNRLTSALSPRTSPSSSSNPLSTLTSRISSLILRRQQTSANPAIVPTTYGSINSGPPPGTVVGIVLGSVAGFIILLWLLQSCLMIGQVEEDTEEVVVRRHKRGSRASARSRRVSETVEVRRAGSVHIVQPPPPPPTVPIERVVVEERREVRREPDYAGSDEIVVIEDHPRRSKSKREKRVSREEPGYRTVDPNTYGGVVGGRRR